MYILDVYYELWCRSLYALTPHTGRAEKRYYALGNTASGQRLFVAFTIRRDLIRVLSIRDMNRKESEIYANYEKANS